MGEMKRAEAHYRDEYNKRDRFASTLVTAASIIAAVRLARDETIDRPSPRVVKAISQSVRLSRMILAKIIR